MSFAVGQRVICINNEHVNGGELQMGEAYTITHYIPSWVVRAGDNQTMAGVHLEGVVGDFFAGRFIDMDGRRHDGTFPPMDPSLETPVTHGNPIPEYAPVVRSPSISDTYTDAWLAGLRKVVDPNFPGR